MGEKMGDPWQEYRNSTQTSQELYERACTSLPGGDTRSVTYHEPYPTFAERGSGYTIETSDGETLLDFLNNYTQSVLGHTPNKVVEAVCERFQAGNGFGAPTEETVELADRLVTRVPSMELVRFCNSGTEATMNAIRASIAFTGTEKILKIQGGYHGTHDTVEVGITGSGREHAGIPRDVEDRVVTVRYNDVDALQQVFEEHGEEFACFIMEPLMGAGGMIPAHENFLATARDLTDATDTVLIFDEVMSFRLAPGGAQEKYDVHPDLTTLGKVIGGGLPVGAFGGRRDIMNVFHPNEGDVSHSGTFNANPATMAGGIATLDALDGDAIQELNVLGSQLRDGVREIASDTGVPVHVTGDGSLFHIHLTDSEVVDHETSTSNLEDDETDERITDFYFAMRNRGIFMAPRGMGNLSTPMEEEQINTFIDTFAKAIDEVGE